MSPSVTTDLAVERGAAPPAADNLGAALATERPRLVRLCRQLTGSADAAEDLSQETLLEAWRLLDRLQATAGLSAWLSAIARNVCLRWQRAQGRERSHITLLPRAELDDEAADPAWEAASFAAEQDDPLKQMEHAEVAALLGQALATLPATTRALTLASAAMSTSELARAFGLTEGAVRVRLYRGRQALRRALGGELREQAEALDLALPSAPTWTVSRIWCPFCGVGHLRYYVDRATGNFAFHCTDGCKGTAVAGRANNSELVRQVSSPKSLVTRHCLELATAYREALAGVAQRCYCDTPVTFAARFPDAGDSGMAYGVIANCPNCGMVDNSTAWHLALDTIEAQRFWRRHPRMRALPLTAVERDNRAAIVNGFAAVGSSDRLVIVSDATTYATLHVEALGAL